MRDYRVHAQTFQRVVFKINSVIKNLTLIQTFIYTTKFQTILNLQDKAEKAFDSLCFSHRIFGSSKISVHAGMSK